jgi:hypothetical protein
VFYITSVHAYLNTKWSSTTRNQKCLSSFHGVEIGGGATQMCRRMNLMIVHSQICKDKASEEAVAEKLRKTVTIFFLTADERRVCGHETTFQFRNSVANFPKNCFIRLNSNQKARTGFLRGNEPCSSVLSIPVSTSKGSSFSASGASCCAVQVRVPANKIKLARTNTLECGAISCLLTRTKYQNNKFGEWAQRFPFKGPAGGGFPGETQKCLSYVK